MKKILKILSVFALASPINAVVSCSGSKVKDENKIITLNCKATTIGDFSIDIKQQQIQTIGYSQFNNDKQGSGFNLDILFKKKTDSDSYDYLRFKGDHYYYYLTEIKFSWLTEYDEDITEFLKKADELYSIFEFEFESKTKTVEINFDTLLPIEVKVTTIKA